MIYLNEKDIGQLIDCDEMIDVIEKAIKVYESNDFVMPDRISVVSDQNTYLYMPCMTRQVQGTKVLTLYPNNRQHGHAVIQGVMLLNDASCGKISCMLDGASLTAFRTGAVGAVGIKYTTPQDASNLGVVGCGVQAYYQILYACHVRDIKVVYLFDLDVVSAMNLKGKVLTTIPGADVVVCDSAEQLVQACEIIITTTTSEQPVLPDDAQLLNAKHFIGIGSYKKTMREFPSSLFSVLDEVYIDVEFAKEESGDLYGPIQEGILKEESVYTLGKLLSSKTVDTSKTTLYKSVGMAMFDILIADHIRQKALRTGIGQYIIT